MMTPFKSSVEGVRASHRSMLVGLRRTSLMLAFAAFSGGFVLKAQSCCEKHACSNTRFLNSMIASGYARCCQKPTAAAQEACFTELDGKILETQSLILTAKTACDNNDDELLRDTMKRLRDLWMLTPKPSASGAIMNEMIALGHEDWLDLDVTLNRSSTPCQPVTVSIVGGQIVNPEAIGGASRESLEAITGEVNATVVSATAPQPYVSCSYSIPSGTSFAMRFGEEFHGLSLSGSIAMARTASTFPTSGVATVALPTNVHLQASLFGETLNLDLDKSYSYNKLEVDASGHGTLGVTLALTSNSRLLSGMVQVGSTIYFAFPVQVSADWSSVRILSTPSVSGDSITPTFPEILAGADGVSGLAALPSDRCADDDNNGIRDGADEVINSIKATLGCEAQH